MNNMRNSLQTNSPVLRHEPRLTPDPDFPAIRIGNDIPFMSKPPGSRLKYRREHADIYTQLSNDRSQDASDSTVALNNSRALNKLPVSPPVKSKKASRCTILFS